MPIDTFTPDAMLERADTLVRRNGHGLFPHLLGINDTTFDPPMALEGVGPADEMGAPLDKKDIEGGADVLGVNIAVWPHHGWMIGLNIPRGQGNTIRIIWMP